MNINEAIFLNNDIDIYEYLLLYKLINKPSVKIPVIPEIYNSLVEKGYIEKDTFDVTKKSYKIISKERNYLDLATKIRELFPKGKKAGKHPWRCSVNALVPRLKKLETLGISGYTDKQIYDAAKSYVDGFTDFDRDNSMMLCMYFVFKDNNSTLMNELENMDEDDSEVKYKSNTLKL